MFETLNISTPSSPAQRWASRIVTIVCARELLCIHHGKTWVRRNTFQKKGENEIKTERNNRPCTLDVLTKKIGKKKSQGRKKNKNKREYKQTQKLNLIHGSVAQASCFRAFHEQLLKVRVAFDGYFRQLQEE